MTSKKSVSSKQATAESDIDTQESVDKIRDIIFGTKMRDYERKFLRLEERIMNEVNTLRDEQEKRLAALEKSIDRELDALVKRLDGEHTDRLAAEQDISEIQASNGEQLRTELAATHETLKQQIEQQSRALSKEIDSRHTEAGDRLNHETDTLREQKVDRSTLSTLLNALAAQISGDSPMEGSRKA